MLPDSPPKAMLMWLLRRFGIVCRSDWRFFSAWRHP
jgi:hypothetical protein